MTKLLKIIAILSFMAIFSSTAYAAEEPDSSYTVLEGTEYYESSWGFGSGIHATVSRDNPYTKYDKKEFKVYIDGYSILDHNGDIIEATFDEKNFNISIPTLCDEQLMVHIWGTGNDGFRLGWVRYTDLIINNDVNANSISEITDEKKFFENSNEKTVSQTVFTLKELMDDDSKVPRESVILADFSGSMSEFQSDVLEKLEGTSGIRYIFSEFIEKFSDEKNINSYSIGGFTDIANALNSVITSCDTHIYLLTDLNDNCGTQLKTNKEFEGEITIVYYPNDYQSAQTFFKKIQCAYPNATLTGF